MRIGPCMQAVVNYVSAHPGQAMLASAEHVGPHGSRCYGYRTVHRVIRAGLVRTEHGPRGSTLLYPIETV